MVMSCYSPSLQDPCYFFMGSFRFVWDTYTWFLKDVRKHEQLSQGREMQGHESLLKPWRQMPDCRKAAEFTQHSVCHSQKSSVLGGYSKARGYATYVRANSNLLSHWGRLCVTTTTPVYQNSSFFFFRAFCICEMSRKDYSNVQMPWILGRGKENQPDKG